MADRAHETRDAPVGALLFWTGISSLAVVLALTALFFIFERGDPGTDPAEIWAKRPQEGPRLQREPETALARLRERDRELLHDGPLSIETAMDQVVEAGWREGDANPSPAAEISAENPRARALPERPGEADLTEDPQVPAEPDPGAQNGGAP